MNNLGYLFAAYAVVWIGIFLYMLWMSSRVNAVSRDLERLLQQRAELGGKEEK